LPSWSADSLFFGIELTELTLSSEASALVSQYKGIIRGMDAQIQALQQSSKELEQENAELKEKLGEEQSLKAQLLDQNTLLKAQLGASAGQVQSTPGSEATTANEEELNAARYQANMYFAENIRLTKELETLRQQFSAEKQRADAAQESLAATQKDQEDLLELLADQEAKLTRYEEAASNEAPSGPAAEEESPIPSGTASR